MNLELCDVCIAHRAYVTFMSWSADSACLQALS